MPLEHDLVDLGLLEEAVKANPNDIQLLCDLGQAYTDVGRLDDSASIYEYAAELNPERRDLHIKLGAIYHELGDVPKAIGVYNRAVELSAEDPLPFYHLGLLYSDQGQFSKAIQVFRKYLLIAGDSLERSTVEEKLRQLRIERRLSVYQKECPDCYELFAVELDRCPSCGNTIEPVTSDDRLREREDRQRDLEGQGFWSRALGYVIDVVFVGVFTFCSILILRNNWQMRSLLERPLFSFFWSLLPLYYFILFEGFYGATIGKVVLMMRVIKVDGQPCGFRAATIRGLLRFVDGLLFGVPAAIAMNPPLRQRIGDRAASTIVVSTKDTEIPSPQPAWRLWLALLIVSFIGFGMPLILGVIVARDLPDLSGAIVTSQDLPQGFLDLPTEEFGLSVGEPIDDAGGARIESAFAAMMFDPFETIAGVSVVLATNSDRIQYDQEMADRELLGEIKKGIGSKIIEGPSFVSAQDIGNASAMVTIVTDIDGERWRMDTYMFRRDVVGAFVYVSYLDGVPTAITAAEVATILDERIVEILEES